MKGTYEDAIRYCTKEETRVPEGRSWRYRLPRMVEYVTKDQLSPQQLALAEELENQEYDYRTINWIWDEVGNWGKSKLTKYFYDQHFTAAVSGNRDQILQGMAKFHEIRKRWPDYVFIDIPRSFDAKYINYPTLEAIKNCLWFSGRYETVTGRTPPVKLVVFANYAPDQSHFSADRWNIKHVDGAANNIAPSFRLA